MRRRLDASLMGLRCWIKSNVRRDQTKRRATHQAISQDGRQTRCPDRSELRRAVAPLVGPVNPPAPSLSIPTEAR